MIEYLGVIFPEAFFDSLELFDIVIEDMSEDMSHDRPWGKGNNPQNCHLGIPAPPEGRRPHRCRWHLPPFRDRQNDRKQTPHYRRPGWVSQTKLTHKFSIQPLSFLFIHFSKII